MTAGSRLPEGSYDAVWASPGRVNLIGEHTDYNDGFVLPFALPHSTVVAARRRAEPGWTVTSEQTGETVAFQDEKVEGWAAYVAGIVWVLREAGHDVPPADLWITSDVPFGAGLSSSAAIECATMAVLVDLIRASGGADLPMQLRPRLAQRAENEYVGAPTGIMDQAASTLCRAGHALFLDCRSLATEQVPFDVAEAGLAVLVIDSKAPHAHVTSEYAARRRSCEDAAKLLGVTALRDVDVAGLDDALAQLDDEVMRRRVRHVVTEDQRVLDTVAALRAGNLRAVGSLMTASHESMRDDYEITVPQVDTAVRVALEHGAYGARMTGGGFGGCVLALVNEDEHESIAAAVREAFAANGFAPPDSFVVTPSAGTRKISR
ncbi:galactokinase [Dactylosporangium sp. AC04546]|uniref:galactokinase n=1 Tax=Dactylosporangium sp. AC04546 TaxID=2862460 RepID=UPI001EDD235D|nr:galactokinase [Dactylosporangium sp. AC04546]WVK82375.1 galactokinase [Dactylosporangium sp. AC04546]